MVGQARDDRRHHHAGRDARRGELARSPPAGARRVDVRGSITPAQLVVERRDRRSHTAPRRRAPARASRSTSRVTSAFFVMIADRVAATRASTSRQPRVSFSVRSIGW